jgi:transcription antitermination factor NusG
MAVRNAGWNVFCAREKKWRVSLWRRKPSEGEADYPRFPGYLFVHVTPPAWPDLSAWPLSAYLSGVLTMGGRPVPLAAREIDRLRAEDGTNVPHTDSVPVHRAFAAGQRALVLAGAFCDFVATIEFIDEAGAHIAVPICGKPADVTLPLTWLRHA